VTADDLSRHPIDQLIRRLIDTRHSATAEDIASIRERMATASFGTATTVPRVYRGISYLGRTLADRDDPLFLPLVKRVIADRQRAAGTTAGRYLTHIRQAVRQPAARLLVYRRRGGAIAAVVTQTDTIVPPNDRGPGSFPLLAVISSADRGILLSGYQASSLDTLGIPQDARWLV
jgi:hypothetical protein